MKKVIKNISIALFIFLIVLAGCAKPAIAPTPEQESTPVVTTVATEPPAVEVTETPEATPEPIPCTIVFDSDRDGNQEIYRMAPDGSEVQNLTNNSANDFDPVWSPDGKFIAFVSNRENDFGGGQYIYTILADGSEADRISKENESAFPDWSPTGGHIAYSSKGDIYLITIEDLTEKNLTNSSEWDEQPKISPDGKQIAWLKGDENNRQLYVMDLDGENAVQVSNGGKVNGVAWAVDGRLFAHWENQPDGICFNCIITADGKEIKDAGGKGSIQEFLPFWTLEGDRVEMGSGDINGTGREDIFLVGETFPDLFKFLTDNAGNNRNPDTAFMCGPVNGSSVGDADTGAEHSLPVEPSQFVIGYEGDFSGAMQQDLERACSELGLQCLRGENFTELASKNVDAIISGSNRWHIFGAYPEMHTVIGQGIPVFVLNAETTDQGAYNLSGDREIIITTLKWMFDNMGEKSDFVYYNVGNSEYIQQIINSVLEEYPGITAISKEATYDKDPFNDQDIVNMIAENPKIGAIWISEQSNNLFWGVNNSNNKYYPLMECPTRKDYLIEWKNTIDAGVPFQCITQIQPGGTAYEGVYAAYYYLSGLKFKSDAFFDGSSNSLKYDIPIITNETLPDWIGDKLDSLIKPNGERLELPPMSPEEIKEKWFEN